MAMYRPFGTERGQHGDNIRALAPDEAEAPQGGLQDCPDG
jgi:hypothetical protein